MRKVYVLVLMVIFAIGANGQLLQQDFSSSTVVSSYVSATPGNGQFDAISTSGAGTVVSINTTGSNKLRFARSGANAGAYSRTTDFSPVPSSMMYRFDLTVSGNSVAQTTAAVWQVGSGFGTTNAAEANANVHSRIGLNWTATTGQFSIRNLTSSTNSANYSGTQTITWVINNSGGSLTYKAPDGSYESLGDDKADIWIGSVRELDEIGATTITQPLTDLKFAISAGTGNVDIDNILIDPVPAIPTSLPASSITSNSFTANWTVVSGVTGYRLDVATDAGFTSFVTGYNNLYVSGQASNSLNVNSNINPSTTYYYRIRAASQYTVGEYASGNSGTQSLTTTSGSLPLITLSPTILTGFTYVAGSGPSGTQSFTVSGINLSSPPGNITVTAPTDYEINDGNGWTTTFNIPYVTSTLGNTNVDVRLKAGLAVGDYFNELISVSGGGDSKNETVSGSVTLGTPVANSPTVFTPNSFTAIWSTVAGATAGYLLDASAFSSFTTTATVASEGFENLLTLFTETTGTGSYSSGNSTAIDAPSTSPFASAGTYAYGKANGSVTITSSNINTSSASGVQLSFRLASFSIGSLANGADAGDIVTVEISPDGGTTYYSTVRVLGNSNAVWAYAATGTASTAYDGNATPVDFTPAGGGTRTTDGYSTVVITNLPSVSNLKIRITLLNNNTAELWLIDDLAVTGLVGSFLTGYNSLPVVGTSQSVTVPGAGTYYFRVRATTGSVISANSNVVAVTMNDQSTATFKSNNSGDYNNTASWLYNVSGSTYIGATQLPANTNDVIIQSGHTLTLSASASANAFTMNTSSGIDLNGNTLSVNGDMVNNGNLFINSGTVDFTKAAGTQILTTGGTGAGKTFYMLSHSGAGTLQLATNGLKVVNNMTNNAGPFSGNGLNVNVGGNLTVNGSYSSGGGTLTFDGSANQNWSGNGSNDYGDVVINKSSGNAVLGSTVQVNNLTLSSGKLVLGSNNFIVGGSVSGGSSSNYIVTDGTGALTVNNIGVPAKTLPIGNSKYNPVTIANGSGHNWTARLEDAVNNVNPPFNTNKAVLRTWTITPSTNPPAAGADLTFQYDDGDPSQLGPSFNTAEDVQLWHYNVAWIAASSAMTPTGSPGSVRTITKTGWSLYSSFAIANQSGPLPVSLVSFSGYKDGTRNQLHWTTANEQNNRGFDIQRSADGVNYSSIGFINTQAVGGTSSDMLNYAFTDLSPAGSRQYYRLRQEDIDGRSKLSNIVLIRGDKPVSLSIDGLFPNPANTVVNVLIAAPGKDKVTVLITDMAGRTVAQKPVNVETGTNTVPVDINRLANGSYLVKLICANGCEAVTGKFVKQ